MKAFVGLLNSLMWAGWVVSIAIFSIQNIHKVSIDFLMFQSIDIPIGVLLAFSAAVGLIIGWFIPLLFARTRRRA